MIITKSGILNYYDQNRRYNDSIHALLVEIFHSERVGKIGYQMSTSENFKESRYINVFDTRIKRIDPISQHYPKGFNAYDHNALGPVEKKLVAYLIYSNATMIVVTGALGSGKTATLSYIREYLKLHENYKSNCYESKITNKIPNIINFNFNEGYSSKDEVEIIKEFELDVFAKFKRVIKYFYGNPEVIDLFIQHVSNINALGWESHFDDFVNKTLVRDTNRWNSMKASDKCTELLFWITNLKYPLSLKIDLLARMSGFVRDRFMNGKGCLIFTFDNIDKFNDEIQIEFLRKIFSISESSKVKTLVNMRLTSFGWIRDNESYSFTHYELAGHSPLYIVSKRMYHYLNNKETYEKFRADIDDDFLAYFDKKMQFLLNNFNKKKYERFYNAFESLSGLSIRRGLHLARRLFLNSAIEYNNVQPNSNDLIRAMLISDHEKPELYSNDRRITNIFIEQKTLNQCTLNIRILQILLYFRKNQRRAYLSTIISHLRRLYSWTDENIKQSLNTLLLVPKRLIYIDGRSAYPDNLNLDTFFNDTINITLSGIKYINVLTKDIVYLLECFNNIDWNLNIKNRLGIKSINEIFKNKTLSDYIQNEVTSGKFYIPNFVDFNSIRARFEFLRNSLKIFFFIDIQEYIEYVTSGIEQSNMVITDLFFLNIITDVGNSIYSILYSLLNEKKINLRSANDEILSWIDLLNIANSVYLNLFDRSHNGALHLISKLEKLIA